MQDLVDIFQPAATEDLRKRLRVDPHEVRVMRNLLLKRFLSDTEVRSAAPFSRQFQFHCLNAVRHTNSQVDGATRLIFRTTDQLLLETVILRIASGRNSVCVSSQVGCAAGCTFCATGHMKIARSLNATQIADQVLQAGQLLKQENKTLKNVVFMGMGEPFHNAPEVFSAIRMLVDPQMFAIAASRIMISTVGLPEEMLLCARTFPDVRLALSLHSAVQSTRQKLIPLANRYPLQLLQATIHRINRLQSQPVMVEYLMLHNVNDSLEDAKALVEWAKPLHVRVNLIPFNSIADAPDLTTSSRDQIARFSDCLKHHGIQTTVRYSLGADVSAACGQLVRRENRQILQQVKQTRPSPNP